MIFRESASPPPAALRSAQFRQRRESDWLDLEELVRRIEEKGAASLSAAEAERLPLLYRSAASSLAVARTIVLDRNLLLYLESLTFRAYLAVYGPRAGMLEQLRLFSRSGFPRAVRAIRLPVAAAFLVFIVGVAAGIALVKHDLEYFSLLVPETLAQDRGPDASAEELLREEIFAPWPGFARTFIVFANSLFRQNAMIGILSFGLCFAFGLPTVVLLAYNGLLIGAFIGLHAERGLTVDFIGWIAIHGVTEILAIVLCGAAGLAVVEKLLFPGRLTRLESLVRHGRQAAAVVAGAVVLFFIAGILEGGFRQRIDNTPGRYAFAFASAALWLYYFAVVGGKESYGGES